jgi:hypothetical protein
MILLDASLGIQLGVRRTRKSPDGISGDSIRWGANRYPLWFGILEFELRSLRGNRLIWEAIAGFWDAPTAFDFFGQAESLQFFSANIRPDVQIVDFDPNGRFPGRIG